MFPFMLYIYTFMYIFTFLKKKKGSTHMEKFYKGVPKAFVALR